MLSNVNFGNPKGLQRNQNANVQSPVTPGARPTTSFQKHQSNSPPDIPQIRVRQTHTPTQLVLAQIFLQHLHKTIGLNASDVNANALSAYTHVFATISAPLGLGPTQLYHVRRWTLDSAWYCVTRHMYCGVAQLS